MIEAMLPALEKPPTPNFLSYMAVGVFTFAYVNFAPGKLHTFRLYRPKLVGGLQSSCEKKKSKTARNLWKIRTQKQQQPKKP